MTGININETLFLTWQYFLSDNMLLSNKMDLYNPESLKIFRKFMLKVLKFTDFCIAIVIVAQYHTAKTLLFALWMLCFLKFSLMQ